MTHRKNKIANMQCKRVAQQVENADVFSFFNLLTSPEILETVETLLPEHRDAFVSTYAHLIDVYVSNPPC